MEDSIGRFFRRSKKYLTISSSLLLFSLFMSIFLIPLFPEDTRRLFWSITITLIFVLSAFSVTYSQKRVALFAIFVIAVEWVSLIFNMPLVLKISLPIHFVFFIMIMILLIVQIARAERVTRIVLLDAVSVYLMLGLSFSIMVALLEIYDPNSFSFQHDLTKEMTVYHMDYIYFSFVTFTSTGYGDYLPNNAIAKSLSIFISVTGQLYLAIIIAMLVGKYSNKSLTN